MSQVYSCKDIEFKVIADSVSSVNGKRITTFELTYPRIIHSELMTHRLFSRNAMSSRAIPIKKMIEQVLEKPAMPVRFGSNQPGMQDKGTEHRTPIRVKTIDVKTGEVCEEVYSARQWWQKAATAAAVFAEGFNEAGYHKQIGNRLLEPYQLMKTIVTSTEWNNFFWLRVDENADPTIYELAKSMKQAYDESEPEVLEPGMWHTPYVDHVYGYAPGTSGDYDTAKFEGYCVLDEDNKPVMLTEEEALRISASCCAQVSYRRLDSTKDKALDIYDRLVSGDKVHASPFEHQSKSIDETWDDVDHGEQQVNVHWLADSWEPGITHVDRAGQFWSGNFCGFIQHRQLIKNNVKHG